MAKHPNSLILPPAAEDDDKAVEMARVWIAKRGLHCVLNVGEWHKNSELDERQCWGVVLADMARHIADALEDTTGLDSRESLKMICESFAAEIVTPSSSREGQLATDGEPATEFWLDHDGDGI